MNYIPLILSFSLFYTTTQATLVKIYSIALDAQREVYLFGDRHKLRLPQGEQIELDFFQALLTQASDQSISYRVIIEKPTLLIKITDPTPRLMVDIFNYSSSLPCANLEDGEIRCYVAAAHYMLLCYNSNPPSLCHFYPISKTICNLTTLRYTDVEHEFNNYQTLLTEFKNNVPNGGVASIFTEKLQESLTAWNSFKLKLSTLSISLEDTVKASLDHIYATEPEAVFICGNLAKHLYEASAPLLELSLLSSIITDTVTHKFIIITGLMHTHQLASCLCRLGYSIKHQIGNRNDTLPLQLKDRERFSQLFLKDASQKEPSLFDKLLKFCYGQ